MIFLFVCFEAKPNKGLRLRSSTRPEVGNASERGVGRRNPENELAKGDAEGQSTTVSRRKQ